MVGCNLCNVLRSGVKIGSTKKKRLAVATIEWGARITVCPCYIAGNTRGDRFETYCTKLWAGTIPLISIYSSVHYFLHLTFANAAGGLYMARHHMAGTADRSTRVMLISRCPRFLYVTLPVCGADPRASSTNASFETKEEGRRKRREFKGIVQTRSVRTSSPRSRDRPSARTSPRSGIGSRHCDFTATLRQSAGTEWPIVCALEKAGGKPAAFGSGKRTVFLFTGRG